MADAIPDADDSILVNDGNTCIKVLTETKNIAQWEILSMVLGVDDDSIQRIKMNNVGSSLTQQKEIIMAWLNGGNASWASLVRALRSPLINRGADANRIARNHPKMSIVKISSNKTMKDVCSQRLIFQGSLLVVTVAVFIGLDEQDDCSDEVGGCLTSLLELPEFPSSLVDEEKEKISMEIGFSSLEDHFLDLSQLATIIYYSAFGYLDSDSIQDTIRTFHADVISLLSTRASTVERFVSVSDESMKHLREALILLSQNKSAEALENIDSVMAGTEQLHAKSRMFLQMAKKQREHSEDVLEQFLIIKDNYVRKKSLLREKQDELQASLKRIGGKAAGDALIGMACGLIGGDGCGDLMNKQQGKKELTEHQENFQEELSRYKQAKEEMENLQRSISDTEKEANEVDNIIISLQDVIGSFRNIVASTTNLVAFFGEMRNYCKDFKNNDILPLTKFFSAQRIKENQMVLQLKAQIFLSKWLALKLESITWLKKMEAEVLQVTVTPTREEARHKLAVFVGS